MFSSQILGNYVVRHRDTELEKEAQKNREEILRLRHRLARAQAGYPPPTPDRLATDTDNINDENTNISIIKLA